MEIVIDEGLHDVRSTFLAYRLSIGLTVDRGGLWGGKDGSGE